MGNSIIIILNAQLHFVKSKITYLSNMKILTAVLFSFIFINCMAESSELKDTTRNLNFIAEELLIRIRINDESTADSLILVLQNMSTAQLQNQLVTDAQKTAFWLNLYNAFIQKILSENPEQYQNRNKFFSKKQMNVAGNLLSFDFIEHGILRRSKNKLSMGYINKTFVGSLEKKLRVRKPDYRIHFALNCGASACPAVAYYSVEKLDSQLTLAEGLFVLENCILNQDKKTIETSNIFSWFRADFGGKKGIKKLIGKYKKQDYSGYNLIFRPYDWDLMLENYMEN